MRRLFTHIAFSVPVEPRVSGHQRQSFFPRRFVIILVRNTNLKERRHFILWFQGESGVPGVGMALRLT
jgi:hypothetical protein